MDDNEVPAPPEDFYPNKATFNGRSALEVGGGGAPGNGLSLGYGDEEVTGSVGALTWNPVANDEFAGFATHFTGGPGAPVASMVYDHSENKADGESFNDPVYIGTEHAYRRKVC